MSASNCPICSEREQTYLFAMDGMRLMRCCGCGLVSTVRTSEPRFQQTAAWAGYETEADAAQRYADRIEQLAAGRDVLLVCDGPHPLGQALRDRKFAVTYCTPLSMIESPTYDCVVFLYSLDKCADPAVALTHAHRNLRARGILLIATPSLDSFAARFFGRNWVHWRDRSQWYFCRPTMQLLLERSGFQSIWSEPDKRLFNVQHVLQRLGERDPGFTADCVKLLSRLLPPAVTMTPLRMSTSGVVITALKQPAGSTNTLSIIMPVYNEKHTVAHTLSTVLAKQIEGVAEREVVLVESNSSDGTREIVQSFEGMPGLKIVYEDAPKGKGHAVRTGFARARGEIILIQDADAEYDINDYDELLKPLLQYKQLFVLGSRHQGDWKIRTFTDQPLLAVLFNCGQIFFTWLMNTLYRQRMTDPFTMYKLFRRECLFGLKFECNRFDFDHELVIKLLRKGYTPLEIPVNYWSRSYSQGKKVTIFHDPLLWIKANFKYRVATPFQNFVDAYSPAVTYQSKREADAARLSNVDLPRHQPAKTSTGGGS